MPLPRLRSVLVAAVLAALPAAAAQAAATHAPGQLVVRFEAGTSPAAKAAARATVHATVGRTLALPQAELLELPGGMSVEAAARRLGRLGAVRYAEPNQYASEQSCPGPLVKGLCLPNDPKLSQQWTMNNTAQAIDGKRGAIVDADVDAAEAWSITRGSEDVVVAVVDSGIAYDNPDIAPHVWHNEGELGTDDLGQDRRSNGVDDDANGYVDDWQGWDVVGDKVLDPADADNDPRDPSGHGTHVAGIIGALGNNRMGVTGLNWNVRLMNVRVRAERSNETSADIADAFAYAARNGARIVNVSLAERERSQYLEDTIAAHPETLFVIAAGNNGEDLGPDANQSFPCEYPQDNIVCVAATGRRDELAGFSNFNADLVDLAAPGMITLSSYPAYQTVAAEGFESDPFATPARWVRGGAPGTTNAWGLSADVRKTGTSSLTSGGEGGTTWVQSARPYDLTGRMGCRAESVIWVTADPGSGLFAQARTDTAFQPPSRFPSQDTPRPSSDTISFSTGSIAAFRLHTSISDLDGSATVYLRYGVMGTAKAYLDDLRIACLGRTYSRDGVAETMFQQGTSMATPHVAGAAALILSLRPEETAAELKADLLRAVDPLPALKGKVRTGGRLNVYKAVATSTASVTADGILRVDAVEGERNHFVVSRAADDGVPTLHVKDPWTPYRTSPMGGSRLLPGDGCERVSDTEVRCPAAAIASVAVAAGDLDDTVVATGVPVPVTLDGGPGADVLTGGAAADTFLGGPGNDTVRARDAVADAAVSCGEDEPPLRDNDLVLADRVDPVLASQADCERVTRA